VNEHTVIGTAIHVIEKITHRQGCNVITQDDVHATQICLHSYIDITGSRKRNQHQTEQAPYGRMNQSDCVFESKGHELTPQYDFERKGGAPAPINDLLSAIYIIFKDLVP
jgi:hypothetical protein